MGTRNQNIDEKIGARMEKMNENMEARKKKMDEKMDVEANKNEIEEIKEQMKVRENIVERNMVSMEEKIKEVEKSVQGRMED